LTEVTMRSPVALLVLSCAATATGFGVTAAARPRLASTPPPRSASRVAMVVDGSLLQQIPGLVAEDIFGSVFMAGMSIAAAGVGTTVFAAFIVNGRYDEIERSMFDAQDRDLEQQMSKRAEVTEDVRDFFGDVNPQVSQPQVAEEDKVAR